MAVHKISVTVDEGTIRVDPDELHMTRQDEVHWEGTNPRKFSIQFEGKSPFQPLRLEHTAAARRLRPERQGIFKYSVISEEDPRLKLDPVIVVEEPPTDPNP